MGCIAMSGCRFPTRPEVLWWRLRSIRRSQQIDQIYLQRCSELIEHVHRRVYCFGLYKTYVRLIHLGIGSQRTLRQANISSDPAEIPGKAGAAIHGREATSLLALNPLAIAHSLFRFAVEGRPN